MTPETRSDGLFVGMKMSAITFHCLSGCFSTPRRTWPTSVLTGACGPLVFNSNASNVIGESPDFATSILVGVKESATQAGKKMSQTTRIALCRWRWRALKGKAERRRRNKQLFVDILLPAAPPVFVEFGMACSSGWVWAFGLKKVSATPERAVGECSAGDDFIDVSVVRWRKLTKVGR